MGYIQDRFNALTQAQLHDAQIIEALWVPEMTYPFAVPAHARLTGHFGADEGDPIKQATMYTLRIPEGFESSGKLLVQQAGGFATHQEPPWLGFTQMSGGDATMVINTLYLETVFLPPNIKPSLWAKRMSQGVRRTKGFIRNAFAEVTRNYAYGGSRGGMVCSWIAEDEGNPFDGMLLECPEYGFRTYPEIYPPYLTTGMTPATDPALALPITPGVGAFLYNVMYLLILAWDPEFLSQGGQIPSYKLDDRPAKVRNRWSDPKMNAAGKPSVKTLVLGGLVDLLAPIKMTTDYVDDVVSNRRQDLVRLYVDGGVGHGFTIRDVGRAQEILEAWVESGTEPGDLVTDSTPDGLRHSKAAGYENAPAEYALAIHEGTVNPRVPLAVGV